MKTYIGTKQVKAEPMNELAAVEKGYARKNEDNHEWRSWLSRAVHQSGRQHLRLLVA